MKETAFEKIAESHLVKTLPDGRMVLVLDEKWCHEITTPNGIIDARARGLDYVSDPNTVLAMIDHALPPNDAGSAFQAKLIREWSKQHNIQFLEIGWGGVCHAVIPETGRVKPGMTAIMGDSHTCTSGALCALTSGVGTTELEAGLLTGLWILRPQKVIRVNFIGKLPSNVYSKDLILYLISRIGTNGATNAILEFGGPIIDDMGIDGRFTMCNMTVEAGATCGMIMIDQISIDYLWPIIKNQYFDKTKALEDLSKWNSDFDCNYDKVIEIDVSDLEPVTTVEYTPANVVPVKEIAGKEVNQVYIASCTNARIEDLRIAAKLFEVLGKPVHPNTRCIVVPATAHIWRQANKEGLLDIFAKAGCYISGPTCGACLGMSCGVIAEEEVCLSTTNRNYKDRMGKGGMIHLASPATAVFTAVNGKITVPDKSVCLSIQPFGHKQYSEDYVNPIPWPKQSVPQIDFRSLYAKISSQSDKEKSFSGKPFLLKEDREIGTEELIPAHYLNETEKKRFGEHCLELVVIEERKALSTSNILVHFRPFGAGSSREQAVWALENCGVGIRCVIAPKFHRIFYTNMFNNGNLCIELVEDITREIFKDNPNNIEIIWDTPNNDQGHITWNNKEAEFPISVYQKNLIRKQGLMNMILELAAELQAEGKL
ncbi:3-isopropylmalate dehydratase large subunit [Patescibacteria group bacterium]|nr:3-isopropylmalate dehydratase large subunit [Patescibacteria group bacterium]MBU1663134.1 3-isopropylmalate dehydratase large subunit [Patescibacteria group bacterium]MBU1933670.1 3-isopropylmalate dehydratase large subunit [Patescibacteria group bacterium]MBU2008119.1 3-isopropylmalate dehydratase large subunit [Patescibacteria group bacterium]MBU2233464.1 3-isopropylmalate dehydratase large subunit [Patescibacteria group bacterium]